MPYIGLVQLIGKYLFLAGLYAFIFWVFRELFRCLRLESATGAPAAATDAPAGRAGAAQGRPQAATGRLSSREPAAPTGQAEPVEPVAATTRTTPCLVVNNAGEADVRTGEVFPLTAAVTIGRARDNSVRISDRYVSNHHAIIFLKDGRRILRDRESTNGTLRNGRRVAGEVVLNPGDIVGVGTVEFEYRAGSATE